MYFNQSLKYLVFVFEISFMQPNMTSVCSFIWQMTQRLLVLTVKCQQLFLCLMLFSWTGQRSPDLAYQLAWLWELVYWDKNLIKTKMLGYDLQPYSTCSHMASEEYIGEVIYYFQGHWQPNIRQTPDPLNISEVIFALLIALTEVNVIFKTLK